MRVQSLEAILKLSFCRFLGFFGQFSLYLVGVIYEVDITPTK